MLPLLTRQIRVGLGADYLAMAEVKGRRILSWRYANFNGRPGNSSQEALADLDRLLKDLPAKGISLSFFLSSDLAPLAITPWKEGFNTKEQQVLFAKAHYRGIYGDRALSWDVVVDTTGFEKPWIASAIETPLKERLVELSEGRPLSIQPLSTPILNTITKRLAKRTCWILIPEFSKMNAIFVRDGDITILKQLPIKDKDDVNKRLAREMRLNGLEPMEFEVINLAKPSLLVPGLKYQPELNLELEPIHLLGVTR